MSVDEQVNHLNELVLLIDEKSELNTKQIQVLSDLFKLVHESIKLLEVRLNEVWRRFHNQFNCTINRTERNLNDPGLLYCSDHGLVFRLSNVIILKAF